jgi:hypothetical protein
MGRKETVGSKWNSKADEPDGFFGEGNNAARFVP